MAIPLTQCSPAEMPCNDAAHTATGPAFDGPCRQVPSTTLLQGGKAVEINHNGAIDRLQSTKLGKLILTK